MKIELTRFKVIVGKEVKAREWMSVLNTRIDEATETLTREEMYVEAIFEDSIDDEMYLTWFTMQGEAGEHVSTSTHEIDKLHLQYWKECIDPSTPAHNQKLALLLLNKSLSGIN